MAAAVSSAQAPVTVQEGQTVIIQLENAARKALKMPASTRKASSTKTVMTRAQIVDELFDLYKTLEPQFIISPRPSPVFESSISKNNPAKKTQDRLKLLIEKGFVAPVGPLVVGPADGLTTKQFGQALGYFVANVGILTVISDPEWSPRLQGLDNPG